MNHSRMSMLAVILAAATLIGAFGALADSNPPNVSNMYHTPVFPLASDVITINATISDVDGVSTATLFHCYWVGEQQYCALPVDMTPVGGDLYTRNIGPFPALTRAVDYYIITQDGVGNSVETTTIWIAVVNYVEVSAVPDPPDPWMGGSVWVNGTAFLGFKNQTDSFPNYTAPASFSEVNVSLEGTGYYWLGQVQQNGDYSVPTTMPIVAGLYQLNVTVTNRTIFGHNVTSLTVKQLAVSHDPALSKTAAFPDETLWADGTAAYSDGSPVGFSMVNVRIEETGQEWPGTTGALGVYSVSFQAPSVLATYTVNVTVSNASFNVASSEFRSLVVTPVPLPDLIIDPGDIAFSDDWPVVGEQFTVHIVVRNTGSADAGAFKVKLYADDALANLTQVASLAFGTFVVVDFDWSTPINRTYTFNVTLDEDSAVPEAIEDNNNASKDLLVDWDSDGDGIGDFQDPDDDNDGVPDVQDAFPTNPDEWLDNDGDGIGNNADPDDDGDGHPDIVDAFPLDKYEWADADKDGVGDNADPDDDNDGIPDLVDAFPADPSESADTDGDGIGDNADWDDDGDTLPDAWETTYMLYPLNPDDALLDNDGDGLDNLREYEEGTSPKNKDTDGDGVWDAEDYAPLDPSIKVDPQTRMLETTTFVALLAISLALMTMLVLLTLGRRNKKD